MYFIELIGFIQYYGVLKRPFLKECVPKKCREIYAQIPPQVGFVPPHLYPPYGGGHIPPHGKISMANPGPSAQLLEKYNSGHCELLKV